MTREGRAMKVATVFSAALALTTAFPASHDAAGAQESVTARIARENLPAVVTLVAVDDHDQPLALGSGFFITRDGVLVTNAHVVGGATKILVRWRGRTGTAGRILNFARKHDLVTLQTSFDSTPAVSLADSDQVVVGQDVIVLGSPQGLEGTVSTGIVGGLRTLGAARLLQITAPISPGSSGGPVFDSTGRVIGIATATSSKGQNLNFALPVNLLRDLPPAAVTFAAAKPAALELREGSRLKDLVYFNNIIEQFGLFAEGTTLASLTASLQNRMFFFFTDPAPPEIYTLSLHDALPISFAIAATRGGSSPYSRSPISASPESLRRSEEHTSELQSHVNLVCRLLLEK